MHWIAFALMTVVTWGLYGAFLNKGAMGFEHGATGGSPGNHRIKAFLFVGVAYFLTAVLMPLAYLLIRGDKLDFLERSSGVGWSLFAGVLGSAGALTVLFALNMNPLKGPLAASQVMSVVFAGAPIVAAVYGVMMRKDATPLNLPWQFMVGLACAAAGGALVTLYKPS